jgi:drug/metabolite transporter (DMT)-like permease
MGILLGLTAALCWGVADFTVAVFSRKVGTMRVLIVGTFAALVVYGAAFLVDRPDPSVEPKDLIAFVVVAAVVVATYFTFYKGLELGPVAIVTPIVAAYAAIVVLLAVGLLDEKLSTQQLIGITAAIIGVALASIDVRSMRGSGPKVGKGIGFAMAAMIGFGLASFGGGFFAQKYGWVKPALYTRMVATVLFLMIGSMKREWPWQVERKLLVISALFGIGAIDAIGFLAFSRGAEIGLISIVAAASASYPLIPLVLGLVVLKEKLAPNQWVGVVSVMGGVLTLALAR